MSKSHTAVRTSAKPTFAQLKELMGQISSGRVTKDSLQRLLRDNPRNISPKNKEMLDLLQQNVELWQRHFPGHEMALASRMMRLFDWKKPLELQKPDPNKWMLFKQAIFWVDVKEVRLVNKQYLACDQPHVPIEDSFAQVIVNEFQLDYEKPLEERRSLSFSDVDDLMITLPVDAGTEWERFSWKLGGSLDQVSFDWICQQFDKEETMNGLLADNLTYTLRVVGTLLSLNERIEDAYMLLEMWSSGNYPVGIDQDNCLVVLCA